MYAYSRPPLALAPREPDLTKECHFNKARFACGHEVFKKSKRMHVVPCPVLFSAHGTCMIKDKDKQSSTTLVSGVCPKCRKAAEEAKPGRIVAEVERVEAERVKLVRENAERAARQRHEAEKEADERKEKQMKLGCAETEQKTIAEELKGQNAEAAEQNDNQERKQNTVNPDHNTVNPNNEPEELDNNEEWHTIEGDIPSLVNGGTWVKRGILSSVWNAMSFGRALQMETEEAAVKLEDAETKEVEGEGADMSWENVKRFGERDNDVE